MFHRSLLLGLSILLAPVLGFAQGLQPPIGLVGYPGNTVAALQWQAQPGGGIAGYYVYRALGAGAYSRITASPVADPSYLDSGLTNNSAYSYKLTTVGTDLSESAFSSSISLTPRTTGPTNVSGTITTNTTWTLVASPYNMTAGVNVAANATLTIEPGVVVKVALNQSLTLNANGKLVANGTQAANIVFTSSTQPEPRFSCRQ